MEYQELILDMLNRIVKLEKEVEFLRKVLTENYDLISKRKPMTLEQKEELAQSRMVRAQKALDSLIEESGSKTRDKTRYMFNGNVYLKNKLVLAVIKDYVSKNQAITCNELKTVFDKSLQGSIGVVENEIIAKQRKDYQVRFFEKEDEILRLVDGNMLVCSQWGILNISNFIKRAEQLGYKIEQIVRE